jgi:seryl-tRNA synthetase
MHDIKSIRDNSDAFDKALGRRNLKDEDRERFSSQAILALDEERRKLIFQVEQWQEKRNRLSKEIGLAKGAKDDAKAAELMDQVSRLKSDITHAGEQVVATTEKKLEDLLAEIPNLPLDEVPDGVDEHGNVVRHHFGAVRNYAFTPRPHDDLGGTLGYMDFETAAKLSGARFVVLKKGLARLERAIGQFMLDLHTNEHGYSEVNPPLLVRDEVMFGTGQLPKFRDDQFPTKIKDVDIAKPENIIPFLEAGIGFFVQNDPAFMEKIRAEAAKQGNPESLQGGFLVDWVKNRIPQLSDDQRKKFFESVTKVRNRLVSEERNLWLIPTAEVPLTNLVRESILDEKELPMRLTALTPCFRAEAGAAGRDTRGMIRQHQFTKVELVSITTPENSKDEHERMLACAEEVLRQLDLHYRVMTLCAGDMGFSAQKTYDIEVWMPGQGEGGAYREISSCSVCGDFQARRMDARYRGPDGKPRFVHTLNGSGTAVGRALIAVMETYQQADGSIAVPDVLQPYMGGVKVVEKDR